MVGRSLIAASTDLAAFSIDRSIPVPLGTLPGGCPLVVSVNLLQAMASYCMEMA